MLKALVIDDEADARSVLRKMLELFCPEVGAVAEAANGREAVYLTANDTFHIAFVDIKLKNENGIDLAKVISKHCENIVFVTAFDEFAVRAFQTEAIHFLLKPVDPELLQQAVRRALPGHQRPNHLQNRLFLRTKDRVHVLRYEDIRYVSGDGNYSTFYTRDGNSLMISHNLSYYENLIDSALFVRSHQSFLVNLSFVREVLIASYKIILNDGIEVPISRRRRDPFVQAFLGMNP